MSPLHHDQNMGPGRPGPWIDCSNHIDAWIQGLPDPKETSERLKEDLRRNIDKEQLKRDVEEYHRAKLEGREFEFKPGMRVERDSLGRIKLVPEQKPQGKPISRPRDQEWEDRREEESEREADEGNKGYRSSTQQFRPTINQGIPSTGSIASGWQYGLNGPLPQTYLPPHSQCQPQPRFQTSRDPSHPSSYSMATRRQATVAAMYGPYAPKRRLVEIRKKDKKAWKRGETIIGRAGGPYDLPKEGAGNGQMGQEQMPEAQAYYGQMQQGMMPQGMMPYGQMPQVPYGQQGQMPYRQMPWR